MYQVDWNYMYTHNTSLRQPARRTNRMRLSWAVPLLVGNEVPPFGYGVVIGWRIAKTRAWRFTRRVPTVPALRSRTEVSACNRYRACFDHRNYRCGPRCRWQRNHSDLEVFICYDRYKNHTQLWAKCWETSWKYGYRLRQGNFSPKKSQEKEGEDLYLH